VCSWANFDDLYKRWCGEVGKVPHTPATAVGGPPPDSTPQQQDTWDAQTRPEHRWFFHPLVDGCEPPPVIK
jgi:hypothetical protein